MNKEPKKFFIYALGIVAWIGFWSYMNHSSTSDNTQPTTQTSSTEKSPNEIALERCKEVRIEGNRLDKARAEMLAEARSLQREWIISEMSSLRKAGKISQAEWGNFSNYMENSLSDSGVNLLEVFDLMDKVVELGYIKLYLPKNVVEVGSRIYASQSSSDYYLSYPECFSDADNQIYKMISEIPEIQNGWGRKLESPMDLIPS
jgi:hypothetical protein